jgi:uncharacterized membrane protein YbaN (DUF454 family)
MAKGLLSRVVAAALLSLPVAAWFAIQSHKRLARWAAAPQAMEAEYLQDLRQHLSFTRDAVPLVLLFVILVLCIEGLAYVFRGR